MTIKIDGANGLGELPGIQLENDVFLDDTGNDLILGTSNVEKARLTADGKLGIGTTNPSTICEIVGDLTIRDDSNDASSKSIFFENAGTVDTRTAFITADFAASGDGNDIDLLFGTNSSGSDGIERMRITNSGYLKADSSGSYIEAFSSGNSNLNKKRHELFNGEVNSSVLELHNRSSSGFGLAIIHNANTTNTNSAIRVFKNTTLNFDVKVDGTVLNSGGTIASSSDLKIKENIEPASPKLDDIAKINFVNFNKIGDDIKQFGVIAQELEEIFPNLVFDIPDTEEREVTTTDENGNETTSIQTVETGEVTKAVKYSIISLMAVKALQELKAENDELKARVEALENQGA